MFLPTYLPTYRSFKEDSPLQNLLFQQVLLHILPHLHLKRGKLLPISNTPQFFHLGLGELLVTFTDILRGVDKRDRWLPSHGLKGMGYYLDISSSTLSM